MTFTGRGLYATSSKEPRRRGTAWLFIGAVLALLVLVVGALAAFASVPLSGDARSSEFDGAEAIEIDNRTTGDVTMHRADGEQFTVERNVRGSPLTEPEEDVDAVGDTVRAEARCGGVWFIGGCEVDYTIGVPDGADVAVNSSTGAVELEEVVGDTDVETSTGSITGEDLQGDVSARTTTGGIDLSGVQGDLDTTSTTGSITAEGSGDSATAESTTGKVDFRGFDADRFEAQTTTGSVLLDSAFSTAVIETTTGEVDAAARESFRTLEVETTTGSVNLDVPDEAYRISGDSGTGERNVDVDTSGDAESRIIATTTTGAVNVNPAG